MAGGEIKVMMVGLQPGVSNCQVDTGCPVKCEYQIGNKYCFKDL